MSDETESLRQMLLETVWRKKKSGKQLGPGKGLTVGLSGKHPGCPLRVLDKKIQFFSQAFPKATQMCQNG